MLVLCSLETPCPWIPTNSNTHLLMVTNPCALTPAHIVTTLFRGHSLPPTPPHMGFFFSPYNGEGFTNTQASESHTPPEPGIGKVSWLKPHQKQVRQYQCTDVDPFPQNKGQTCSIVEGTENAGPHHWALIKAKKKKIDKCWWGRGGTGGILIPLLVGTETGAVAVETMNQSLSKLNTEHQEAPQFYS